MTLSIMLSQHSFITLRFISLKNNMNIHFRPLYLRSMFRDSVCVLMASRIESAVTSEVSRTQLRSSCIDIRASRTDSKIGVGSIVEFSSAQRSIDEKISISGAQNESREINSFTDCWKQNQHNNCTLAMNYK